MNFVMSYSCGKDSTLALHRMVADGHIPVGLLIMINEEADRSWFHGVDEDLLHQISESLNIPLILCRSKGDDYLIQFENGLLEAKNRGAECCVFGDIDIEDNAAWCRERCNHMGLTPVFPLWQQGRENLTHEFISLGYIGLIKCVRHADLPKTLLGKPLDDDAIAIMKSHNIDICGENGEYHTLVVSGPLFRFPLNIACKEILDFTNISAVNIVAQ
ncbi:MAG: diphthine--ammonia ligase [Eubacterium sp.]